VIRESKIRKKSVELKPVARPSRIRRDPMSVEADRLSRMPWWQSREWEIRLAIIGIVFVTLALNALVFDVGELLSR
jgi:hypothetical protein